MYEGNPLDPRSKLFFVALVSSFAVAMDNMIMLVLILILTMVVIAYIGQRVGQSVRRLGKLIYVVLAIAIIQSIVTDTGDPLIQFSGWTILTDYGVERAIQFLLRVSIIVTSSMIVLTSSTRDLIQGLLQLKIPYELVFMLSIAAKFLPILRNEMVNKVLAMELQGIDLEAVGLGKKLKVYRYLLLPVTVNSLLKSRDLAVAMEMRGFRAMETRTSYRELSLGIRDYIFMTATAVAVIGSYMII